MRALLQDVHMLWRNRWSFRVASLYLAGLAILVLILPALPLPYTPNHMDLTTVLLEPFRQSDHLLGTDQLGRDVLVNSLYGARNGLFIALPVMLLATIMGTAIGATAGYVGNASLRLTRATFIILCCCLFILGYFIIYIPLQTLKLQLPGTIGYTSAAVGFCLCLCFWFAGRPLLKLINYLNTKFSFPVDGITLRIIELVVSLPKLLILITVAAFAPPSVTILSIIFVCTFWTGTARLARAEMLRIKQLPYLEAAIGAGIPHTRLIFKHAIPNMISPLVVAFIFGVASLLAIESTLSFLGIGLPATFPSWGRTIAGIRSNLSAWWLVAFPGGLLACTVLALQICCYHLVRVTQERGK